jgi:hypothetical protein
MVYDQSTSLRFPESIFSRKENIERLNGWLDRIDETLRPSQATLFLKANIAYSSKLTPLHPRRSRKFSGGTAVVCSQQPVSTLTVPPIAAP